VEKGKDSNRKNISNKNNELSNRKRRNSISFHPRNIALKTTRKPLYSKTIRSKNRIKTYVLSIRILPSKIPNESKRKDKQFPNKVYNVLIAFGSELHAQL
jgi:hypothetical protein